MDAVDHAQVAQERSLSLALNAVQQENASRGGVSAIECEECGNLIPEKRRMAVQGCNTCIDCQQALEQRGAGYTRAF